jgi:hypothetical protein
MKPDKIFDHLITEMFRRVGLDCTIEECIEYASKEDWYQAMRWTPEEQEDFSKWAYKELAKLTRWSARQRKREVSFFLLQYGWTTRTEET